MSRKRARPPTADTCVHLMSRTVDGSMKFRSARDKMMILDLIKRCARFASVQLKDYVVLDNHFHIEAHIPPRPEKIPREVVLLKIEDFYQGKALEAILRKWDLAEELGGEDAVEAYADTFRRRMFDMAEYMKTLKQLITINFNKRHHREGTLWQRRYTSVLVQGDPAAASRRLLSAYIGLNPVRAGLADDPGAYPFSAYGEAMAGDQNAREGLMSVMPRQGDGSWEAFDAAYKELLYKSEEQKRGPEAAARLGRAMGLKRKPGTIKTSGKACNEVDRRAKTPAASVVKKAQSRETYSSDEILRQSVRVFKDGLAIGDKEFVESVFRANRALFGPKRETGARPITVCPDWRGQLYAARDLRKKAVTCPLV